MAEPGMVIVGAGMAGARAIVSLRASGFQGPVTLIGEESFLPYDRPPLSKSFITDEQEPSPALLLDEGMLASLGAEFIRHDRCVGIDRAGQHAELASGRRVPYLKLLLATGARPRRLNVPGGERAILLRDFPESQRLRQDLRRRPRTVIIGGGFIGLELAAAARQLGCDVTLIESLPRILMRGVPPEIAEVITRRHEAAGVRLLTGAAPTAIGEGGVALAGQPEIAADLVIAGIGAIPAVELATAADLQLDNGIACDERLQTSDPNIFAAGDCCSFPHPLFGGKRLRLEAWRNATDQANVATENMLGGTRTYAAVPWFWSDQYDLSLQIAGLPADGSETVRRELSDQAFVIFHRDGDGRLVGASGIGPGNSIARDVKLAEMLIARRLAPAAAVLADAGQPLKALLKA